MSAIAPEISSGKELSRRLARIDWTTIFQSLEAGGHAVLPTLLSPEECREIRERYEEDNTLRSRVIMARHGFGRGEYKYFSYPLPPLVQELRTSLYSRLVPLANQWNRALRSQITYPAE